MATVPINLYAYLDSAIFDVQNVGMESAALINAELIFRPTFNGWKYRSFSTGTGVIFNWPNTEDAGGGYFNTLQNAIDYYTPIAFDHIMSNWFNDYSGIDSSDVYIVGEVIPVESPAYEAIIAKVDKTTTVNGHALTSNVTVSKSDIGLGNVDNTADNAKTFTASQITDFSTAADARITAQKGANSGLCPLDSGGQVASAYLPSYVDDVIDSANFGALPGTGVTGKIYVTTNDNKCFRWSGSAYIEVSPGPGSTDSVTEGSVNKYFTDERAQDAVGGALSSEFVYNDGANTIGLRQRSFTNNASRSLVTGTGATGFQVSSTRDAAVNYNVTTSTTATIGGASNITVVLEVAPTNSATAGDWVEISRYSNGQTITLAVVLQSVQTGAGNLGGIIPAGYYAKLRTITTGTASASYNTGQEVLL